jgi:hypothetical protein
MPESDVRLPSEMHPSISIALTPMRSAKGLYLLGALGCVFSGFVGVAAATHYGEFVGGVIVVVAFAAGAIRAYGKDPVAALVGLWLFTVFDAPISAVFGYFSSTGMAIRQGDEVLVLLFAAFTLWRLLRSSFPLPPARFVLPGLGVCLFGVLSSILHDVPLSIAAVGALLGLKLWFMIAVTLLLPWRAADVDRVYRTFIAVGLIVAALGIVDFLTHGAVSRTLHTSNYNVREGEYRSNAVHSIFPDPGEFSLFMSLLFGVTFARFTSKYSKSDLIISLLFAGSVMLSLRLKGFLSLAAVVAIVGIVQSAGSSRRAVAAFLIGVVLVLAGYALEGNVIAKQVSTYTSSESTARSRLYTTGEQIASDNFPFGVGFGRFASYPSRLNYSPVYYQYKLNRVYGLSPAYPSFIDDTSWPGVIGETGYGGFALYVFGLIVLVLSAVKRLRSATDTMKWLPLAALCTIAVILVDSIGDPSLFSWLATATVAMIFAPTVVLNLARPSDTSSDLNGTFHPSRAP